MLLGAAISLTVDNLPIVVQDLDNPPPRSDFIDAFRASITFHVVAWPVDRKPEDALTSNEARAVLIIPGNFGRDIARGTPSPVQLLVDASDSNTAQLVAGDASQITRLTTSAPRCHHARSPSRPPCAFGTTRAIVEEVLRPGNLRAGHLHVSAAAGRAGHGQGRRAEDHSAGLRLQHLGARISARQDFRVHGRRARRMPADDGAAVHLFWPEPRGRSRLPFWSPPSSMPFAWRPSAP